jgi:hypothetical protein
MKKAFLLIIAILMLQVYVKAQTAAPEITELRDLLKSAKNNFANDLGKVMETDSANHTIYYETKKPSGQNMYVISYDAKGDKVAGVMPLVDHYLDELNNMLKTGNYTGKDYKNTQGKDVTDIRDKDGNLVLRYASNLENQSIFLYGPTK